MAEQLDEIPEWKVSEQFVEEKLRGGVSAQDIRQNGEDLSGGLLSEDMEIEEEVPGTYLPGEMRTSDIGEEPASNTLDIPEEMDIEDLVDEVHSDSKVSSSLAMPDVPEETDWNTLSNFPDGSFGPVGSEDDEYELSSLLERLDLTENIRRMNESAQEDIADVIERESEPVELSAAVPAIIEDAIDMETDSSGIEILQPVEENSQETMLEFETADEPAKLPKYKKPELSLNLVEPAHEAEEEEGVEISEYDMVPTIDGLEKKWKKDGSDLRMQEQVPLEPVYVAEEAVQPAAKENDDEHSNGFAYSLADIMPASTSSAPEIPDVKAEPVPPIPKKNVSFDVQPERHAVHTEEIIKKSGGARRAYHRILL